MYFGYLPLMAEAGLLELLDPTKIAQFGELIAQFTSQEAIRDQGELYGVPWNWGSLPLMYDPAVVECAGKLVRHHEAGAQGQGRDGRRSARQPSGLGYRRHRQADRHASSPRTRSKKVIDKLIEIRTNHARAFFADLRRHGRRLCPQRSHGQRHRLGSGGGLGEAEGQDDRLHDPARKGRACSWIACASRKTRRIPS